MRSLLKPNRFWRNSTGPGLSSLTASATSPITGSASMRIAKPTTWSNSHFITRSQSVIGASNTSSVGTSPR